MFIAFGHKYWQVGDSVIQAGYPGCEAIIYEVVERQHKDTLYRLKIDVRNHPEGVDENGEPVDYKTAVYTAAQLEVFGN